MKRILALIISVLIMILIFSRVDMSRFAETVAGANPWLFAAALVMFIPQILLTAWRWQVMTRKSIPLSVGESASLILAASALNILLPARMGDLAKAYFLKKNASLSLRRGTNLVIFEKYLDLAALSQVLVIGILFEMRFDELALSGLVIASLVLGTFPVIWAVDVKRVLAGMNHQKSWKFLGKLVRFLEDTHDYLNEIKADIPRLAGIICISGILWASHFIQFYFIFRALGSDIGLGLILSRIPLALYVGLIPVTLAGIGTRDSALLFLFSSLVSTEIIVGVGIFASIRYFVPGLLGLPFLNSQITMDREILEQAKEQGV